MWVDRIKQVANVYMAGSDVANGMCAGKNRSVALVLACIQKLIRIAANGFHEPEFAPESVSEVELEGGERGRNRTTVLTPHQGSKTSPQSFFAERVPGSPKSINIRLSDDRHSQTVRYTFKTNLEDPPTKRLIDYKIIREKSLDPNRPLAETYSASQAKYAVPYQ
jgi:hypothetical protein